jgi:hypothetical protein
MASYLGYSLVFRWLAIPWLQAELDAWVNRFNSSPRRANKNKVLPQGIPDIITAKPQLYHSRDFKVLFPYYASYPYVTQHHILFQVLVTPQLFNELEEQWAPPDDPVFQLVPPAFEMQAQKLYTNIGRTPVSSKNIWQIYTSLLSAFRLINDDPALATLLAAPIDDGEDMVPLLPGLRELRHGDNVLGAHGYHYMGGLNNPPVAEVEENEEGGSSKRVDGSVDLREFADFSDVSDVE